MQNAITQRDIDEPVEPCKAIGIPKKALTKCSVTDSNGIGLSYQDMFQKYSQSEHDDLEG